MRGEGCQRSQVGARDADALANEFGAHPDAASPTFVRAPRGGRPH